VVPSVFSGEEVHDGRVIGGVEHESAGAIAKFGQRGIDLGFGTRGHGHGPASFNWARGGRQAGACAAADNEDTRVIQFI
jgi:hypothetical protein